MKYFLMAMILGLSTTTYAGVGSFALGYMIGKSKNKKSTSSTIQYAPSEIEELKNKIIGGAMSRGWAFDFNEDNLKVEVQLANYNQDLVLQVLNDLKNDKYPVSLNKNGNLVFDWKTEYCENNQVDKPLGYKTLLKVVADTSLFQVYNYFQCPFLQKLSDTQKRELIGKDFNTDSYMIGGGRWVEYQFVYERYQNTYQKIETKTQELKAVAEKYCNMKFKDSTSKVLSHVLTLKESYLTKDSNNEVKLADLKYSHKRICEQN